MEVIVLTQIRKKVSKPLFSERENNMKCCLLGLTLKKKSYSSKQLAIFNKVFYHKELESFNRLCIMYVSVVITYFKVIPTRYHPHKIEFG